MNKEEASFILANIDRRVCDDELNEALDIAIKALEQEPCDELDFVQPHKKVPVNLEVCKMREATQEEREGIDQYIDSIAEPCEDAISREDALMALTGEWTELTDEIIHRFIKRIKSLPPVNPQPKTAHWIDDTKYGTECSECGKWYPHATIAKNEIKYCSECGAKMIEPQESEG